jgi:hypothetical protein
MTIKIGNTTYKIRTPGDLDAVLVDATGCDATEMARMIGGTPQASHLARALHPFLHAEEGEVPHVSEVAAQIAAADDESIAGQVRALYARKEGAADGE